MENKKIIKGFSKLGKREKIKWLAKNFFSDPDLVVKELISYWHTNDEQQKVLDGFSENTISNFVMPYGVAPNFLIDGTTYAVPMVIEESSVVAAASAAAKFWLNRGGFHTEIIDTRKIGQVHFIWNGELEYFKQHHNEITTSLRQDVASITERMEARGGGIIDIQFLDLTDKVEGLFQLKATFETCDSMGANFINSVLEQFAISLKSIVATSTHLPSHQKEVDVIMSILSNYTPECLVKAWVECTVEDLGASADGKSAEQFAYRFFKAVDIAKHDVYRATTHNKGIYNGIDAVVLATGNDFRAIEACGHAYAARDGQYRSLSKCSLENGMFRFELEVPLALGTVGGLTSLHPMAKRSLEMLNQPTARELMSIITSVGLAQNFAAVRSLITTGIQKGHMKMHMQNILHYLNATEKEKQKTAAHFEDKTVSHHAVVAFVEGLRKDVKSLVN